MRNIKEFEELVGKPVSMAVKHAFYEGKLFWYHGHIIHVSRNAITINLVKSRGIVRVEIDDVRQIRPANLRD